MSVFKPFNRRATKRVLEPVSTHSSMSPREIDAAVEQMVDDSVRHAFESNPLEGKKGLRKMLAEAGRTVHLCLDRDQDRNMLVSWCGTEWVARLHLAELEGGGSRVTCQIVRWNEKDGEIQAKDSYLKFLDDLAHVLRPSPPAAASGNP